MQGIEQIQLSVSDAVGLLNQTLETIYPQLTVVGELVNFKISKDKWVYFDIRDEYSKLHCFGTIYVLPGPLEDGMLVEVVVAPRLHPQFGFTANLSSIRPVGEGSLVKAANLLQKKLETEGLFAAERKRNLPQLPQKIALVTSDESAAYSDFIKIANVRWPMLKINVYSVLVQGVSAPEEIVEALSKINQSDELDDVVVLTRGGGNADDLSAFSDERVVRAVASSRVPTLVAIGHERDISLSELAADSRASTPSNAAEVLLPDRQDYLASLQVKSTSLVQAIVSVLGAKNNWLNSRSDNIVTCIDRLLLNTKNRANAYSQALSLLDPSKILKRGYVLAKNNGNYVKSARQAKALRKIELEFYDGDLSVTIE